MTRRRMPRIALIALAAFAAVALWAPAAAADESPEGAATDLVWSVKPTDNAVGTGRPNFGYRADPGATVEDSLDVTNRGDTTLTLRVYAADAFTPQGGGIDLLPGDETSVDVGSWITLATDSITVGPQETVVVPFTLTVPANATPGDHAGGIVTTSTSGSGAFAVERRLGSRVIIRVAGALTPKLEVSDVAVGYGPQFNPFSPSTATVSYTVANTGNVRLDAHPALALGGPAGILGRTVVTEDLGELLPGNSRHFRVEVPAVWALFLLGATVTLQPFPSNANDSASQLDLAAVSARGATFALNWGQLILLGVVVIAVVVGIWWRRRRKATVQAAIDAAVEKALAEAESPARATADD